MLSQRKSLVKNSVLPMGSSLTNHVQVVGVVDGAVLVLHYARVVPLVWRHHAFHDEAPVLVTDLGDATRQVGIFSSRVLPSPLPKELSLNDYHCVIHSWKPSSGLVKQFWTLKWFMLDSGQHGCRVKAFTPSAINLPGPCSKHSPPSTSQSSQAEQEGTN